MPRRFDHGPATSRSRHRRTSASAPARQPIRLGPAPSPAKVRRPVMASTPSPSPKTVSTPPTARSLPFRPMPPSIPWGLAVEPVVPDALAFRGVDVTMVRAATRWAARFSRAGIGYHVPMVDGRQLHEIAHRQTPDAEGHRPVPGRSGDRDQPGCLDGPGVRRDGALPRGLRAAGAGRRTRALAAAAVGPRQALPDADCRGVACRAVLFRHPASAGRGRRCDRPSPAAKGAALAHHLRR